MADVSCPGCSGTGLIKWGKGGAGRQKYRCQGCGRQFVAGSDHLLDREKKKAALQLLADGVESKKVATALGISVRWASELKRRMRDAS